MENHPVILKLETNPKTIYDEAVRLLMKIAQNIIDHPKNSTVRCLKKENSTISQKILTVNGGSECLKLMGFVDKGNTLIFPASSTVENLRAIQAEIYRRSNCRNSPKVEVSLTKVQTNEVIRQIILPPLIPMFSHPFLKYVEEHFHQVLVYEDANLRERARKLIPGVILEQAAAKLQNFQISVKKGLIEDTGEALQDVLVLELLIWFKKEFFTWVDSPVCENCDGKCVFKRIDEKLDQFPYTNRIEVYECESCSATNYFPRYTDLNVLLETRRGRCGEWANVFTLFCRAMDWDARYVVCETDHVWTEVYSHAKARWIHCDPCEMACDTPLMYEKGWGKKLSYVFAYSHEEVQDVTWRYSGNHKELKTRRTKCREQMLVDALISMRTRRQEPLTSSRKLYLQKRVLMELVELLQERQPKIGEKMNRSSGSLTWRLARRETKHEHVFQFDKPSLNDKTTIRYSIVRDQYEKETNGKLETVLKGWQNGVFSSVGLFKKEEHDWNMIYLCREESEETGEIAWKFQIIAERTEQRICFDSVDVSAAWEVFENGIVDFEVNVDGTWIKAGNKLGRLDAVVGTTEFVLRAKLSGGSGDTFWQHAQLFRQSTKDRNNHPFSIDFTFKKARD